MSSPIRACYPDPVDSGKAFFFKDDKYVVIKWTPGSTNDTIVKGPLTITDDWASLKQANFTTVDSVLANPDVEGQALFFSGDKFALVEINSGVFTVLSLTMTLSEYNLT